VTRCAFNFTGRAIPGYDAPQCILLRPTASVRDAARCALFVVALTLQHMALTVVVGAVLLLLSVLPEMLGW
jgi:hypothetical protein